MEFHGIWLCSLIPWNFLNSMELLFQVSWFHGIPWNSMEFGVSIKFHGTFKVPWNSMELLFWHGKVSLNSMEFHGTSGEFHGIPWNSMELWNININKFHNWGSVFHRLLYDIMLLYIRQSISSWNIEIFQFQSNFLVPPPHYAQMAIFHSKWRPVLTVLSNHPTFLRNHPRRFKLNIACHIFEVLFKK